MHVRFVDELSLALVSSTRARAKIVSVDFSAALAAPGVVDYVDYKDLPGNNMYGLIVPEIELLPQSEVGSFCYIPNSLSPGMGGKIMKFSQICPNRNTTPNSFFEQYLACHTRQLFGTVPQLRPTEARSYVTAGVA